MTLLGTDRTLDMKLHRVDGSHISQSELSADIPSELALKARLGAHLLDHIAEGLVANQKLRDEGLRAAADTATKKTIGRVYFAYATQPESTTYYIFQRSDKLTKSQALGWLAEVAANPERYE